jgi:GT2 family glycosyltransferase
VTIGAFDPTDTCSGTLTVTFKSDTGERHNRSYDLEKDVLPKSGVEAEFGCEGIRVKKELMISLEAEYDVGSANLNLMQGDKGWIGKVIGMTNESYELKSEPTIAVVIPVHGVGQAVLRKALRSVGDQSYDKWIVAVHVEDGDEQSFQVVREFQKKHVGKVLVSAGPADSGISVSLNRAINSVTTAAHYAFLDCDDELHPNALVNIAKAFSDDDRVALVYTDEDKIDPDGSHCEAHYKPDFSREMLLSQNYPCHLTAAAERVVNSMLPDVFNKEYDGSQDHDFWLRCTSSLEPGQIVHIPKILYHWRKRVGSTASSPSAKTWAFDAGYRAVRDNVLKSSKLSAVYRGPYPGTYRVRKEVTSWPDVYVVIPTKDNAGTLESCLLSLQDTEYQGRIQMNVVCNGSSDETIDKVSSMQSIGLLNYVQRWDNPFNWSAINNVAIDSIFNCGHSPDLHRSAVVFMNDDVEALDPLWLDEMIRELWQDGVGIVGPKLLYPDMRIQHAGVVIGMGGVAGHGHKRQLDSHPGYFCRPHITQQVSAVTGACMACRVDVFLGVGGFEENLPMAFNDIDFCLRAREAGYSVVYTPWARLVHHESLSRGIDAGDDPVFQAAIKYMESRWGCRSYRDPFFNPNLDLLSEVFKEKQ